MLVTFIRQNADTYHAARKMLEKYDVQDDNGQPTTRNTMGRQQSELRFSHEGSTPELASMNSAGPLHIDPAIHLEDATPSPPFNWPNLGNMMYAAEIASLGLGGT